MSQGNILVIDDELIICNLFRDFLEEKGLTVEYALSGADGLEKARQGDFDVVITDLKMPDMDGMEILKEVKGLDKDKAVILITGYPSFETVREALSMGAYDYFTKPFNIEEVSFVVQRAVDFCVLVRENRELLGKMKRNSTDLEANIAERVEELTALCNISKDILSTLRLDETLTRIVDNVTKKLGVEICSILLWDHDSGELTIKVAKGLSEDIINSTRIKAGEKISGWIFEHRKPVLVEDIESDPYFARRNNEKYYNNSFISAPLIVKGKIIGVLNVNNKKTRGAFNEYDLRFVEGIAGQAAIALYNAQLYTSLEETYISTVRALTFAIDAKDHYTKTHSEHVTEYALAIAREMGVAGHDMENIKQACQLHDLGKIGVHDYILTKPDKLSPEEWEEIRQHSLKSGEILKPLAFLKEVIELVEQHHERYDGKGYPFGLKAGGIKPGARIMSVADSYDAMTTERPYRKALSKEEAIEEIKLNSGTQFDPKVVEAFLRAVNEF